MASHAFTLPSYLTPLMMLVGLGVGVDYALLIFTRYRFEIRHGVDRDTAGKIATDTAGRSVLFAGCTVIVALLGLFALGLGALRGVALGVALTVLVTMLASITLLPALMSLLGRRLERRIIKRSAKSRREPGDGWRAWGGLMQRHPVLPLLLSIVVLLLLSIPALSMRLGFADAGTDPSGTSSRDSYDLMAEGFGPGANGPLIVMTEGSTADAQAAADALADTDHVAGATPAFEIDNGLSMLTVFPETGPQDAETAQLVDHLRDKVLPSVTDSTGADYLVGGSTASAVDFSEAVSQRMPLFLLIVVGVSTLLLAAVFRSVLIPLKAALLNVLSIGAALGVV
ncbi:MAG: MMPL family transporter, partial [Stackebrandtia sp.]